jgi:Cofilin/tropomyosin-type actin-binding protein
MNLSLEEALEKLKKKELSYFSLSVNRRDTLLREVDTEPFLDIFPKDQCRYVLRYSGSDDDLVVFIVWAPDKARMHDRILHRSFSRNMFLTRLGLKVCENLARDYDAVEEIIATHFQSPILKPARRS